MLPGEKGNLSGMDPKLREGETLVDDNSAKKKFKFKSFKKLFGKKKRKETLPSLGASGLKQSQSASDVTVPDSLPVDYDSEDEVEATAGVLGSRAVSHDSIFIPEIAQETARPIRIFSQENVSDRIKALQLKLQSNIKVGPPPFGLLSKRSEDAGTSSEDDGLPRSPPEMSLLHEAIKTRFSDIHRHHHSSLSLAGTGSEEDEQISSETSSRPLSPDENELKESHKRFLEKRDSTNLSLSADFSTPPQYSTFLDNSAARHRLSVKPRNQRLSKNRRPSAALQEESIKDLTYMEEEDIITPRPEQVAYSSLEADSFGTDNILNVSLEDNEASSDLAEVNELLSLPEVVQDRCFALDPVTTPQSENVLSASDTANIELDAKIKDQIQLVSGKSSENVPISLPTVEKQVFSASSTSNQEFTVKESKAQDDVTIKPSVVEETVVHSSRTTSLEHSQESFHSRRNLFQNSLSEKRANYEDQPLSDKENHKQLGNGDTKVEKSPTETFTQRKFSVSSAWERPRTGSFSLNEAHKTTKLSLLKPGMSKIEILKEESKVAATNPENKPISRKTESLTDPEGMPTDKAVFSNINPSQAAVPAANDLPVVAESQADSEDKNPFFVKLRSTSLSLRYRDGINPVESMLKRHSAEFKQAKSADLSFSKEKLNTEKTENKDHDDLSSKSENVICKSESTEGTQAKPPLPKKPVLQNITVADNNTNKEASENVSNQEKKKKSSETKIEKKVPDRRPSLHKTIDKNNPVGTAELVKATESKTEPTWMSMARQKQRSLKEDRPVSDHSIVNQDSEKQNKDRAEVHSKQQIDLMQNKATSTSVSVLPETYGQDTKAEKSEQRQRANTLPHPVHATQLSLVTEKEEKTLHKRQTFSVSQEPSWMELAKKKSQAWSDKPQIIK